MKYVVATAEEVPPGGRKIVEVGGRSVGVFNLGGEYVALLNRCPHQGGPLCEGKLWGLLEASAPGEFSYSRKGEILTCGWHGWEFDVRTGKSWCDPSRIRLRQFAVSVAPGAALVEGPHVAETFAVSVEDDYVVLEA